MECNTIIRPEIKEHFKRLGMLEPKLFDLEDEITILRESRKQIDILKYWYREIKPQMLQLVGYSAQKKQLQSETAYDIAYEYLYFNLLQNHKLMYRRGDIYYCDLSKNTGNLQKGIRPVLILQNNRGNHYSPTIIITTLTTMKKKTDMPTHVEITSNIIKGNNKEIAGSIIQFEQIFTINKKDLKDYVCTISLQNQDIKRALKISLGIAS